MFQRVIAIDGPAASGKSSVSRGVASALGCLFVSSGHFYRAIAWGVHRDSVALDAVAAWLPARRIQIDEASTGLRILIDGEDATPHLSASEVATLVSRLASLPAVRDTVNAHLRMLARHHDLVMEGRDIGSVVFPETPYKFYLDASPEERARRRSREGSSDPVAERDRLDATRATAPLIIPEGAFVVDTTHLSLEEVIATVLSHLETLPPR